jgi:outer membrane protein assembly factor BamD (BamD/ComL family)
VGGKHRGKRKHVYVYFACLIFLFSSGCATYEKARNDQAINKHLVNAKELFFEGYYGSSLAELKQVLTMPLESPFRDDALFYTGLIYAHYENSDKDYKTSRFYFKKLIREYPQSPLTEEAKIWVNILLKNEMLEIRNEELEIKMDELATSERHFRSGRRFLSGGNFDDAVKEMQKILALPYDSPYADDALFYMGLIYAHYDNPKKDYAKARGIFEKVIKQHPQSLLVEQAKVWAGVLDVIEKSKQVDIEIEEKMKKLTE